MDRSVIEICRTELQRQLDETMAEAERTVADMTTVEEENFPDPTDRALLESNRNFMLRLRDRDRKLVTKLKQAINAYLKEFEEDPPARDWHGINAVALLALAQRRGL